MSVQETCALFKEENSLVKIGFRKFCASQPQNAPLVGQCPHQAYVCVMTTFTGCAIVCPAASQILLLIQGDLLILYVAQIPRVASLAGVMNVLALCFFESVSDEDLRFMITWYQ